MTTFDGAVGRTTRERRSGSWRRRFALAFCFLAGLGLVLVAAGFVLFVLQLERREKGPIRHADGVVALTGGQDRVAAALSLLAKGDANRLLISGVNPNTSEAEIARLVPDAKRLFDCCVELGYRAENTIGNAAETRRWVRLHRMRSLIVVTSNYHMPRAMAEIAHAAPGVDLVPFPVVTAQARADGWWPGGHRLRMVAAEYLKFLFVQVRLRLSPAEPPLST